MKTQQTTPALAVANDALFGLSVLAFTLPSNMPPVSRETHGPGICGYCNEPNAVLKTEPRSQKSYCRKCAPGRETDADWPNAEVSHGDSEIKS